MKTLSIAFTTLVCFFSFSAKAESTPEVIFTGDSWVTVPCVVGSIDQALFSRGLWVSEGNCFSTSKIGVRADNFKRGGAHAEYLEVMKLLKTRPHVKVVYMSLGGNDMFKFWTNTMGADAEQALYKYILGYVQEYVNDIHAVRPDVWVLVSGYDNGYMYANNPFAGYRKIYVHMGSPTPAEVYGAFKRFYEVMAQIAGDHTVYQQHVGVMHYYYGAPEANVAAYRTLAPRFISTPQNPLMMGGVPGFRNNKYAMAHIFDFYFDPHHLRPMGFVHLFEHSIDTYIGKWLKGASYRAPSPEEDAAEDARTPEISEEVQARVQKMVHEEYDKLYSGDE